MAAPKIDPIASWYLRLRTKVYSQFENDPDLDKWIRVLGSKADDLEAAAQSLLTLGSIDNSEGVQLDGIGLLVGQPRAGTDDPTYRLYLRARIAANDSNGTAPDLYKVFLAMLGGQGEGFIRPEPPAGLLFHSTTPLSDTQAGVLLDLLREAHSAGVRLLLEWQPTDAAGMLILSDADDPVAGLGLGLGDADDYTVGGELAGLLDVDA